MKKSTAKKVESQSRGIIQKIGFEDFSAVCQEYQIIGKATRELLELAKKEDTCQSKGRYLQMGCRDECRKTKTNTRNRNSRGQ